MNMKFYDLLYKIEKLDLVNNHVDIPIQYPYMCSIEKFLDNSICIFSIHTGKKLWDQYHISIEFNKTETGEKYAKYSYVKKSDSTGEFSSLRGDFSIYEDIPSFNIYFPTIHDVSLVYGKANTVSRVMYNTTDMEMYFDKIFKMIETNSGLVKHSNRYTFKNILNYLAGLDLKTGLEYIISSASGGSHVKFSICKSDGTLASIKDSYKDYKDTSFLWIYKINIGAFSFEFSDNKVKLCHDADSIIIYNIDDYIPDMALPRIKIDVNKDWSFSLELEMPIDIQKYLKDLRFIIEEYLKILYR